MKPKSLVHIGWLLVTNLRDSASSAFYEEDGQQLQTVLQAQFPQFTWRISFLEWSRFSPQGMLDPLPLLEFGYYCISRKKGIFQYISVEYAKVIELVNLVIFGSFVLERDF